MFEVLIWIHQPSTKTKAHYPFKYPDSGPGGLHQASHFV